MKLSKIFSLMVLGIFGVCIIYIVSVAIDQRDETIFKVSKMEKKIGDRDETIIGNEDEKLFWFIQVTDLHISKYRFPDIVPKLKRFMQHHVPIFSPDFILISGDLTDAKTSSSLGSEQYLEEWQAYKKLIDESKVLQKTKIFDLRGNHDAFDVPHLQHQTNLYRTYSIQGKQHRQSYMYTHRKPYGTYSFIAMDACPNPGPKRPYNFYGVVSSSTIQLIQHYSHLTSGSNMTIWFGHYPTSTVVAPGYDLRTIIGRTATAYLCGHLHSLAEFVPKMYTLQPQGYLELELGDWKEYRYFRIVAIDHDLMSFVDSNLDKWPIVMITNPKDSSFLMPHKEPAYRIARSTHIRILAFSVSGIESVEVSVNGESYGQAKRVNPQRPLYTVAWNPKKFMSATDIQHLIQVTVKDKSGRIRTVKQTFSTTETPNWKFRYVPSILLSSEVIHLVRVLYYSIWITLFSPVILMRFIRYKSSVRRLVTSTDDWLLMLYQFSTNDFLFYPWILYFLYSACGPLMIGSIITGGFNFVFVHGLYVNGVYIPESSPYITETVQNLVFFFPVLIYFCRRISSAPCHRSLGLFPTKILLDMRNHWGIYILMFFQFLFSFYSAYMPYGVLAFILSPCRLGLIGLVWFMHRSTIPTSQEHRSTLITSEHKDLPSQIRNHD